MNGWRPVLLALLTAAVSAAQSPTLTLEPTTGVVRPGHLVRAHLSAVGLGSEPVQVAVALLQGDRQLARMDLDLDDGRRLNAGIRAVLDPPSAVDGEGPPLRLIVTVSRGAQHLAQAQQPIDSLEHLRARFLRLDRAFGGGADPLPALWLEQAAERVLAEPTLRMCADLAAACRDLEAWQRGVRIAADTPGVHLLALRDPVDGSVQPLRLHRPVGEARGPISLLLSDPPQPSKGDWPLPKTSVTAPLLAAGWTVVEAYPAGDHAWSGCAPRRAWLAWRQAGFTTAPVVIGTGRSAHAALLLAERQPSQVAGVVLIDARLPSPPRDVDLARAWGWRHGGTRPELLNGVPIVVTGSRDALLSRWLIATQNSGIPITTADDWLTGFHPGRGAAAPIPTPRAPLPGIDPGPITVVIGTGEHVAAAQANRALAEAFVRACATHAQGTPVVRTDTADLATMVDHHLVLIGSPRSNQILAQLVARGLDPRAVWDQRSITAGGESWLRADRRPLAIRRPRPGAPGRIVLILDGAPSWSPDALPGADLADLYAASLGAGPPLRQWFDSDWR